MLKKIFVLTLSILLIFSLVACENSSDSLQSKSPETNQQLGELEKEQEQGLKENTLDSDKLDQDKQDKVTKDESEVDQQEASINDNKDNTDKDEKTKDDKDKPAKDQVEDEDELVKEQASIKLSIEGPGEDEYLYKNDAYPLSQEKTALELLEELEEAGEIRFEYKGSKLTAYLQGINDYYEFDEGPLSGWMIEVNGEFPLKSIASLVIKDSDLVRFRYTLELGDDLTD